MGGKWPKVIRDPVHDVVVFEDNSTDRLLLDLIDSSEFQRLRRIRQLGLSEYVYPGATCTRFSHCIGVVHVARKIIARIRRLPNAPEITEEAERVVLSAALLHDIGHGPLSHVYEALAGGDHENWTRKIIISNETQVGKCLGAPGGLSQQILDFFDIDPLDPPADPVVPPFLVSVVKSQLDCDRFDYLLRDSHYTGTKYGIFDLEWLIGNLFYEPSLGYLCIGPKGVDVAEEYVFARYHAYRSVYFHKTTRSAEVMLKQLFARLVDQVKEHGVDAVTDLAPGIADSVRKSFERPLDLPSFLSLDDGDIWGVVECCGNSPDSTLRMLGTGLLERHLLKAVTDPPDKLVHSAKLNQKVRKALADKYDPDWTWFNDSPADTPYHPYDPMQTDGKPPILVKTESGELVELSNVCDSIKAISRMYRLVRYYCPAEVMPGSVLV